MIIENGENISPILSAVMDPSKYKSFLNVIANKHNRTNTSSWQLFMPVVHGLIYRGNVNTIGF